MRSLGLIALLTTTIAAVPAFAAAPATPRVARVINQEYAYDPPPATVEEAEPVVVEEDPVVMEAFTVTESIARRDLERTLARRDALREAERFKPLTGGKIRTLRLSNTQVDLGIWPILEEREVAHLKGQDLFLKVDLFRLKW